MILGQIDYQSLITPMILAGIISLLAYVYKSNSEQTKQRIDARSEEIERINDNISAMLSRLIIVETNHENLQKNVDKSNQQINEQLRGLSDKMDKIYTLLMKP